MVVTTTANAFDATLARMFTRVDLDGLPEHLGATYGVEVTHVDTLDVGVLRVDRAVGAPWVVRVFSTQRPVAATAGDAALLRHLAAHDFPAERLATKNPISTMSGQQVLVTEYIAGAKSKLEPDVYERLGRLLGRLHSLPLPRGAANRPAGSLHHFAEGGRRNEQVEAARWLDQIENRVPESDRGRLDVLREALADADDGSGLPTAIIHPDPAAKNMVRTGPGEFSYVDWTGGGVGPRVASLEFLLGSVAAAPKIMAGYAKHVRLTDEEWDRLPRLRDGRLFVSLCFQLGLTPEKATTFVKRISGIRRESQKIAAAARLAVS